MIFTLIFNLYVGSCLIGGKKDIVIERVKGSLIGCQYQDDKRVAITIIT